MGHKIDHSEYNSVASFEIGSFPAEDCLLWQKSTSSWDHLFPFSVSPECMLLTFPCLPIALLCSWQHPVGLYIPAIASDSICPPVRRWDTLSHNHCLTSIYKLGTTIKQIPPKSQLVAKHSNMRGFQNLLKFSVENVKSKFLKFLAWKYGEYYLEVLRRLKAIGA